MIWEKRSDSEFLSSKSISEWWGKIKFPAAIFLHKNGERRRKASFHCAVRHNFTSSRGDSRSSLNLPEALLVKTLHFITLVKSFRCAPLVKFSPCGSKDGVPLLTRFAYMAASCFEFSFAILYYFPQKDKCHSSFCKCCPKACLMPMLTTHIGTEPFDNNCVSKNLSYIS